jgi:hypothetical protein
MYTHGVTDSTGLPHDGQPVEFVLDGRKVAIVGTYAHRIFRSRWSVYGVERVSSWRSTDVDSSAAASLNHADCATFASAINVRDDCN